MEGFELYCQLAFGTDFDPKKPKRRKNKLKNYKENKKKRFINVELNASENDLSENKVFQAEKKFQDEDSFSDFSENDVICGTKVETPVKIPKKREKKQLSVMHQQKIRQEEVIHFRRINKIYVDGCDVPDPVEKFEQLVANYGVNQVVLKNIQNLGYSSPTPIQMQAIPLMLHNRQILACAPTGSGKTAAFLIPVIHNLKMPKESGFRAVIIAPTRELVMQIYSFCVLLTDGTGLKTFIIKNPKKLKKNPEILKNHDILITTPNRLIYLLKIDPPILELKTVEWFVVDECDKLFEVGKQGFRDQLAFIYQACESAVVKRALFSATFSHDVEVWCKLNLDGLVSVSVGEKNSAVETIKQELCFVGSEGGKLLALRNMIKEGFQPPVLIFVQSKERAQDLYSELVYDNVRIDVMHADLSQTERDEVIQNFLNGKVWILICTELMARGIDFKGVNIVVNYDFPTTAISYIHRIGRTGRAGEKGRAITYFTTDDVNNLRSIAQVIKNAGCEVPDYIMKLKKAKRKRNKSVPVLPIKRQKISSVPKYQVHKERRIFQDSSKKNKLKKKIKPG